MCYRLCFLRQDATGSVFPTGYTIKIGSQAAWVKSSDPLLSSGTSSKHIIPCKSVSPSTESGWQYPYPLHVVVKLNYIITYGGDQWLWHILRSNSMLAIIPIIMISKISKANNISFYTVQLNNKYFLLLWFFFSFLSK